MPEINHDGPKSESIIETHLGMTPREAQAERIEQMINGNFTRTEPPEIEWSLPMEPVVNGATYPDGVWYIEWGQTRVHYNNGETQHDDWNMVTEDGAIYHPWNTLHERLSERINWWLSDRVRQLRFVVFDLSDWLERKAHALGELEDRLLGL